MRYFMSNKRDIYPILNEIRKLSLPVIGEVSLNTLVGMLDTMMLSYMIGKNALSASGFTNQIVFTLIFIFTAFNVGATALISRNLGEKNFDRLRQVAAQSFSLSLLIGLILTLFAFFFKEQLFSIFDLDEAVRALQMDYFKYLILSILPLFLGMNMGAILRGAGDTKTPLKITLLANILNVVGNYILIKGVGPFPSLGIQGAAIATTFSRLISFALYAGILFRTQNQISISFRQMGLSKSIMKPLLNISLPSAFEQALMQISFLLVGVIVSQMNTASEAGFRVLLNIESISYMPAVGLSIASATLCGKALGEKNKEKAFLIGKMTSVLSLSWGILTGLFFVLFPKALLYIFTNDAQVIALGVPALIIAGINQPFLNYIISSSGTIRGAGATKSIMILTILRLWGVNLPLAYYFVLHAKIGLKGVWLAELISFSTASLILLILFQRKKWLDKEIRYE